MCFPFFCECFCHFRFFLSVEKLSNNAIKIHFVFGTRTSQGFRKYNVGVSGESSMLPIPRSIGHLKFSLTGKHSRAGKGVQNSIGSAQFHFKVTSFVSIPKNTYTIFVLKLAFEYTVCKHFVIPQKFKLKNN